mmetsp:Transcript_3639/g.5598  ORF Transcript_3639/g.5598 Transcript_3639/m.5598 type:complete len:238 (+) Transcript_3639:28-741(+)
MSTRFKHAYLARLAEHAERYDEMTEFMKQVVNEGTELDLEERNLLSAAYKNAVGQRRSSWRVVASLQQKANASGDAEGATRAEDYRTKVEGELNEICQAVLSLLEEKLVPASSGGEPKVFYLKMAGDYYRYIAEFSADSKKDQAAQNARRCYEQGMAAAVTDLPVTNPVRLGLALNFSVFYYEVLKNLDAACQMARKAFEEAIPELDHVSEDSYKDSTLIMQLLRDNLNLWTAEADQ